MMMFGLRLGDAPRVIVTTTPKPKDLILDLVGREGADVVIDRASTYENSANLAPTFKQQLEQYKGSKLYEQEVMGALVDLEDGKVVSRDMFKLWPAGKPFPKFEFIVQSYDCAFTDKEYNDPTAMTTWGVFKPLDGPMSCLLIDWRGPRCQAARPDIGGGQGGGHLPDPRATSGPPACSRVQPRQGGQDAAPPDHSVDLHHWQGVAP